MLNTPVVFVIFNRPDLTERVFKVIAQARPAQLQVIADGPRREHPADAELCRAARAVTEQVDWRCEVVRDYAVENLGCKRRVSSGLTTAFERFERLIVLEDDVLPDLSMFPFFQDMLTHYADDRRIMMVTGFNPLGGWKDDRQQYHYSFCGSIWGWASWRRAWNHYDVSMARWSNPEMRDRVADVFADPEVSAPRLAAYDRTYRGEIDTWDFQWSFARAAQSGLSIVPSVNLVTNLGFRGDATHTRRANPEVTSAPSGAMRFPIRFHDFVAPDRAYDLAFTRHMSPRPAGPQLPR